MLGIDAVMANLWNEWGFIAFAAILLSTAFASLVYMLGHFLSSERMIAFGKTEVIESFYSAILIIVVLAILATATDAAGVLIKSVYPGPGEHICGATFNHYFNDFNGQFPCHMRMARYYLDTLYAEGKIFNYELLSIHMWYSFFHHIGINADFHEHTSGSVNFTPLGSALSLPNSIYSYMFEFGMKSMVIIRFQQFLLSFINYSIYPVFVILGLILRTFPFSRRLGGLLMAMGISLFFIFPMFYVFGAIVFKGIANNSDYQDTSGSDFPNERTPEVITSLKFNPQDFYENIAFIDENEDESMTQPGEIPGSNPEDLTVDYMMEELYPSSANYCQTSDWGVEDGSELVADWAVLFLYAADFTTLTSSEYSEQYIDGLIGPGGVIDATARLVFFSMFFAILSVFSTIGAIRSLSPLLGGDIELAGLTHLI